MSAAGNYHLLAQGFTGSDPGARACCLMQIVSISKLWPAHQLMSQALQDKYCFVNCWEAPMCCQLLKSNMHTALQNLFILS